MMDNETFLTPQQCLEYGFCDEIAEYQADQNKLNQQAAEEIRHLRQELSAMKSFREEMKQFPPAKKKEPFPGNPEGTPGTEQGKEQKVLKMLSAFFDAFNKEE